MVPLTLGVILSAVTELNLVLLGFLAAIAASLANVLNSIYTKRAISHVACPDPIIFHMYTAATATIILLPYALLKDARDWLNGSTTLQPLDIRTPPATSQSSIAPFAAHGTSSLSLPYCRVVMLCRLSRSALRIRQVRYGQ